MLTLFSKKPQAARPTTCQACGASGAEAVCHACKTERPAYTALKRITARMRGLQPVREPLPACRYFPAALCDCEHRGECVPVA